MYERCIFKTDLQLEIYRTWQHWFSRGKRREGAREGRFESKLTHSGGAEGARCGLGVRRLALCLLTG